MGKKVSSSPVEEIEDYEDVPIEDEEEEEEDEEDGLDINSDSDDDKVIDSSILNVDATLIDIENSKLETKELIITNWIKMLINRGWLKKTSTIFSDTIKTLYKDDNKDLAKNDKYILKFIFKKVSSIKGDNIVQFIEENTTKYIFFVIAGSDQTLVEPQYPKLESDILKYNNVEVFTNYYLMEDRLEKNIVPHHELLTDEQQINKEYGKIKKLGKILLKDPMCKYFNAKAGQVFAITMASNTSGPEIIYKICTH